MWSFGFVSDGAGGLGDVVGSEDLQGTDGEVADGGHGRGRICWAARLVTAETFLAGFGPAGGLAVAAGPDGEWAWRKAMPPRLSAMAQVLIERNSRRP